MKSYGKWLVFRESASNASLFNYLASIERNPNVDDIKTLINMVFRNTAVDGLFQDMWPRLSRIMAKLPANERQDIETIVADMKHQSPNLDQFLIRQGIHRQTVGPYKLKSPTVLQDELEKEMDKQNPTLMQVLNLINANKDLFHQLDPYFQKRFKVWIKEEAAKTKSVNWSRLIGSMFDS